MGSREGEEYPDLVLMAEFSSRNCEMRMVFGFSRSKIGLESITCGDFVSIGPLTMSIVAWLLRSGGGDASRASEPSRF